MPTLYSEGHREKLVDRGSEVVIWSNGLGARQSPES